MSKKLTTEEFIKKAKFTHNNKYIYPNINYIDSHTNILIICPEHGEFKQTPNSHLNGHGCPQCALNLTIQKLSHTKEKFIKNGDKIHNNKYDYSKVIYKNARTHVTIICPEHGEFKQKPHAHLRGQGCPQCAGNFMNHNLFLKRGNKVHNNRYDYSKVIYENARTYVVIICPEHGEFKQTPDNHLKGKGCSMCAGKGFNYLSYQEVKKIIKPFKIKSNKDYKIWWEKNETFCRKKGIPKTPDQYYKNHM